MRAGIDLGGTKIEVAALDHTGAVHARLRHASPPDYSGKLKMIAGLLARLEAESAPIARPVGIAHPGSANPSTGLIRNANSTVLNGRALIRDLEAALERPVRGANDADCFALSEAIDGAGAGAASVFGVIIGTGVGGGIVVNRALWTGASRIAGEWGHTPLPSPEADERDAPPCWCGRAGCIESWCSGPALSAHHARLTGAVLTPDVIAARAQAGDAAARISLERHGERLARGLAAVVNILDPEVIVLGGGLSNLPGIAQRVGDALRPKVFCDAPTVRVVVNRHGDSSGVRGAAWLWPEA